MSAPRIVAFTGPTLEPEALRDALGIHAPDCQVLGPAQQGDVIRACRLGCQLILLIDGYFQSVPAVWHKEILWALSRGVHVMGAASMGALRAAELHGFGMVGIGSIFEWFRDGTLERDDEVAVAHAGPDHGYRGISEALVNVRATVSAAEGLGVLTASDAVAVVERAAAMFYPDRNWPAILDETSSVAGAHVARRLATFLRAGGRVDQKRLDAINLIDNACSLEVQARPPRFTLAHTVWFDKMHRAAGEFVPTGAPASDEAAGDAAQATAVSDGDQTDSRVSLSDLTDELRLARRYREVLRTALLRRLATDEADRLGVRVGAFDIARHANEMCRGMGLTDQAQFDEWLTRNGLTLASFNALVRTELRAGIVLSDVHRSVQTELADVVRMTGMWPGTSQRAARKVKLLAEVGLADPGLENTPFASEQELAAWWSQRRPAPSGAPGDVDAVARSVDFADSTTFVQVLLREYCAQSLGLEPIEDGEPQS